MANKKNIILFVGAPIPLAFRAVKDLEKHHGKKYRTAFLYSKKYKAGDPKVEAKADIIIRADINNLRTIESEIWSIKDEVVTVVCRSVFYMPIYAQVISLFPKLCLPSRDSIEWCQNKLMMRRKFRRHYPEISPQYTIAKGYGKKDIDRIKKQVGFPCVVKPASLAASRFVSVCFHEEELISSLRKTFRGINSAYKKVNTIMEPMVVVEQFMEGMMISIDGYVDSQGKLKCLPAVHVKTGQDIGIDDFFGYRHFAPTLLVSKEDEKKANDVAQKAIECLALRNTMVHMEFIKIDDSWKVLEVDARMGGHRDMIYRLVDGTPHGMNDILVRMGEKPVIKKKVKHFVASFNFFSPKKGTIKSIKGLKKVRELQSLQELIIITKVGMKTGLSKDGYKKVIDITLANKSRQQLLADIRRMEKAIKIEV